MVLGEVSFRVEDVTSSVEPARRADVMHTHLPVAVGTFHQILQRDVLMGSVRAYAGLGSFPLR